MIIDRDESCDLAGFLSGLQHAARGILRVESIGSGQESATGWLITDTLAIVPSFIVESEEAFSCRFSQGDNPRSVKASVVYVPSDTEHHLPAVLRLMDKPPQPRALILYLGRLIAEQPVMLLHHPGAIAQARLTFGRILDSTGGDIRHDAATAGGSAGAPLLQWDTSAVVGMHIGSDRHRTANTAVSVGAIIESLQSCAVWEEIARFQNLADVVAAKQNIGSAAPVQVARPPSADPDLIAAALQWGINPATLPKSVIDKLIPMVANPDATTWALSGKDRRRLLSGAGSLEAIRNVHTPNPDAGPGQRSIDRVLAGPPYPVKSIADDELPYWLQATRWFRDIVPGLPSPGDITRELDRRRVRGQLTAVAGTRLWGRDKELQSLSKWYADESVGPLMLSGVGGVGKSALLARFALDQPADTVLFWLDFDRADLAADDAVSVLTLLINQLRSQLDTPEIAYPSAQNWRDTVDVIANTLDEHAKDAPVLLVLDGFEIAQHAERHHEIWQVLDYLVSRLPATRLIVSGRAPATGLQISGRQAMPLELKGLPDRDARDWLTSGGVLDGNSVKTVLDAANGIPLVFKLALRLYEATGAVEFPNQLSKELVNGYLYQRILDRVIDPALRPLASDALVLRRLTPEMLAAVLHDRIPQNLDTGEVFTRLAREMALVEVDTTTVGTADIHPLLRLRPELRTATLRLLESASGDRVTEIDHRAVDWYRSQEADDPGVAAELIYHLLRLGNVEQAQILWRDAAAPLLVDAEHDIPEAHADARAWLHDRVNAEDASKLAIWEHNAFESIRAALGRGINRSVESILAERDDRTADSPLILYDAWQVWQSGDLPGARQLLQEQGTAGRFGRDRAVLAARLAVEDDATQQADEILAGIDNAKQWMDWKESGLAALAVRACRLRLTIDVAEELDLLRILEENQELRFALERIVVPGDFVVPALAQQLDSDTHDQLDVMVSAATLDISHDQDAPMRLRHDLDRERTQRTGVSVPALELIGRDDTEWPSAQTVRSVIDAAGMGVESLPNDVANALTIGAELALHAIRRWHLASQDSFLADVCETAISSAAATDPLAAAVVGTLGALGGHPIYYSSPTSSINGPLTEVLSRATRKGLPVVRSELSLSTDRFVLDLLRQGPGSPLLDTVFKLVRSPSTGRDRQVLRGPVTSPLDALLVCLVGSDPLDMLLTRVLGLPAMSGGPL